MSALKPLGFLTPLFTLAFTILSLGVGWSVSADPIKPHHPFFYRIEVNGHVSWLLGTIHSPYVRVEDFDPSLRRALDKAEFFFSEAGAQGEYTRLNAMVEEETSRAFPSLTKLLTTGASARWKAFLRQRIALGTPKFATEYMDHLPPGVAFTMLEAYREDSFDDVATPAENPTGQRFDYQLAEIALKAGKKLEDLDPRNYSLSVYKKVMTAAALSEYIMKTLDRDGGWISGESLDTNFAPTSLEDRTARYVQGDLSWSELDLTNVPQTALTAAFAQRRKIIVGRHDQWFPKLLQKMKTQSVFAFVGAKHVEDPENGLVTLFAREPGVTIVKESLCASQL